MELTQETKRGPDPLIKQSKDLTLISEPLTSRWGLGKLHLCEDILKQRAVAVKAAVCLLLSVSMEMLVYLRLIDGASQGK